MLFLVGCGPGLEFNTSQEMTRDQMLQRATHVFVGVIEKHDLEFSPFFRVPGDNSRYWRILRRTVRVEMVLRGSEQRNVIPIYEIFWTGGTSGDWNLTHNKERCLFLVRLENGRYHVVRDWWRSIFSITSGRHTRLPLDESRPFWERVALMMWWVQPGWAPAFGYFRNDPGDALTPWRTAKLLRGLFRHPDADLRLAACEGLLHFYYAQDECWEALAPEDRRLLNQYHNVIPPENAWRDNRRWELNAYSQWSELAPRTNLSGEQMSDLRLLTTLNNQRLRREFCRKFQRRFPQDVDNGCPADRPPPATMVTENGDVALTGAWPMQ